MDDEQNLSEPVAPSLRKIFPGLLGAGGLLLFAFFIQIMLMLGFVVYTWFRNHTIDTVAIVTSLPIFIITYIVTFGGTVWFGWRLTREPLREVFRFRRFPYKITIFFVPLLFGLAVVLFEVIAYVTQVKPVSSWLMELMRRLMEQSVWLALLTGGVIGPFLEELLFRGLILRGFLHRYKPGIAIAASSFLFGLLHLNIWQFFSAFGLGLVLGWLYQRTRSLWPCFILHAVHNSTITFTGTLVYSSILDYPKEIVDATVMPLLPWWLVSGGALLLALSLLGIRWMLPMRATEDPAAAEPAAG